VQSRFLPEPLANQQKVFGEPPPFPASLARDGAFFVVHARICVSASGEVEKVELLRRAHPTLDANVVAAAGRWRYRPLEVNGSAVPFCTLAHFQFRAT
jgi:TonB family protein